MYINTRERKIVLNCFSYLLPCYLLFKAQQHGKSLTAFLRRSFWLLLSFVLPRSDFLCFLCIVQIISLSRTFVRGRFTAHCVSPSGENFSPSFVFRTELTPVMSQALKTFASRVSRGAASFHYYFKCTSPLT